MKFWVFLHEKHEEMSSFVDKQSSTLYILKDKKRAEGQMRVAVSFLWFQITPTQM